MTPSTGPWPSPRRTAASTSPRSTRRTCSTRWTSGCAAPLPPRAFVTDIDYDARGQRQWIGYGNGASTTYEYDPNTFRLIHLKTTRPADPDATASLLFVDAKVVQDLRYTYDPAGNITRIEDAAHQTVVRDNETIEPVATYTYDAVYRLIEANGREHAGQNTLVVEPQGRNYRDHPFVGSRDHPNDLQALRNYTDRYEYDEVGNFDVLRHLADGGGWTRRYHYEADSLLEGGKRNNRLSRTVLGDGQQLEEPYRHDEHGNMTSMPHLPTMAWDFEDQLQRVDLRGGGSAWYVYDAAGQRVRKVVESQNGVSEKERLYVGGFEIYREFKADGAVELRRDTLHVMDDRHRVAIVDWQTVEDGAEVADPVALPRYQLGSHLGSASVELNEKGALVSYEEYHPHGTTSFQTGRTAAEVSLRRYRYTGKERDEETGFGYHGARYYAAWLGRWVAADPAGTVDGVNIYRFVRNRPSGLRDDDGMSSGTPKSFSEHIQMLTNDPNVIRLERPISSSELARRTQYVESLALKYGYDPKLVHYTQEFIGPGGGVAYQSGEIALNYSAFTAEEGTTALAKAEGIFLHELGHQELGHPAKFSGKGIETPIPAEIEASAAGLNKATSPEVKAFLERDIARRTAVRLPGSTAAVSGSRPAEGRTPDAARPPAEPSVSGEPTVKGEPREAIGRTQPREPPARAGVKGAPAGPGYIGALVLLFTALLGLGEHEIERALEREDLEAYPEALERVKSRPGSAVSISEEPPPVCDQVFLSAIPMVRCSR